MMSMQLSMILAWKEYNASFERVTSLKKIKLKTMLPPYTGLVRIVPVRNTDAVGAEKNLCLPCVRCDSIQAATCLLTNEEGLVPVSNRVVTERDEELLLVEMQYV